MIEPRELTSDQKRAKYAWEHVQRNRKLDSYVNFTKGAPAFIMSNGLMQALAFYWSRKEKEEAARAIALDIIEWLPLQTPKQASADPFESAMKSLYAMPSMKYMQATREALAMLRWLRQFADALKKEDEPAGKAGEPK
jgi:CRISPR-associated protein Cmr5